MSMTPLFPIPSTGTVLAHAAAEKVVEKAGDVSTGVLEPLNRGTDRQVLRGEYETARDSEQRYRGFFQQCAEQIPESAALAASPPKEPPQFGWFTSHATREKVLSEDVVRAEEREQRVQQLGQEILNLQEMYGRERELCAERREAAHKALSHEKSSSKGWTGWF